MNEKRKHIKESLRNIDNLGDADIDYSDSPEVTEEIFSKMSPFLDVDKKQQISIRLDKEIVEYFKTAGKGYQSKINAVLREYVRHIKHP